MGELARFSLEQGLAEQPDLAERYWAVVEELAAHGDEYIQDAVSASLIEYFAWGTEDEQAALRNAERLHGWRRRRWWPCTKSTGSGWSVAPMRGRARQPTACRGCPGAQPAGRCGQEGDRVILGLLMAERGSVLLGR